MSISFHTEEDFIHKLQKGDNVVFAQLYKEYHDEIFFYIKKMVANADVATDIISETFGKVWKKKEDFPSIANIKAFLYTTSRNLAIDWLRRQNIRPDKAQSSLLIDLPETAVFPTIEAEMIKLQVYKLLHDALDQLEPNQKMVLKSLFIEEKSIKEICRELNVTPEVVWARKSRGLKKLREQKVGWLDYFRKLNFSPVVLFM